MTIMLKRNPTAAQQQKQQQQQNHTQFILHLGATRKERFKSMQVLKDAIADVIIKDEQVVDACFKDEKLANLFFLHDQLRQKVIAEEYDMGLEAKQKK